MFTAAFWKDAAERAVKTFAQALLALFVTGATILDINWQDAAAVTITATIVSLLTSVVSAKFGGEDGTASLVGEVTYDAPHHIGVE